MSRMSRSPDDDRLGGDGDDNVQSVTRKSDCSKSTSFADDDEMVVDRLEDLPFGCLKPYS